MQVQFFHNMQAMRLHGVETDHQQLGDFPVHFACGDQLEDFPLARGQRIAGAGAAFLPLQIVADQFFPMCDALCIRFGQMYVCQQIIVFLAEQKTGKQRDIFFVEPVARHPSFRIVALRRPQPAAKPVGIYLVAGSG